VKIAILDPDLTVTAPRNVTAAAGFDAIAHAVETAVTTRRTMLSETFSHRAWALLNGAFETVLERPNDLDARSAMLLGAHFAGIAIEQSMLGAAHACANPLTARADLAHGPALASVLPHVVRWNGALASDRYAAFLESSRLAGIEALARRLEDLAGAGGLNMKLRDHGVTAASLPELAELAAQQWTGTFNPRPFDRAGALEIYGRPTDGLTSGVCPAESVVLRAPSRSPPALPIQLVLTSGESIW
jgi:alcohol dehydrogenase